jgi:hypothetical protein
MLMYVLLCVIAMTSVVNNIGGIPAQLLIVASFMAPLVALSCLGAQDD